MSAPYRRATAVCVDDGALLCVRLHDPTAEVTILSPPGGGIEAGEGPLEAAARETLEETGLRVEVDQRSERVLRYPYTWDGRPADVVCHVFGARLLGPREDAAPIQPDPYGRGVVWLPLADVREALAYLPVFRDAVWDLVVGAHT